MGSIRERREVLGLTQGEAATKAQLSLATWRRLESDDAASSPRRGTVAAVERALQLRPGGLAALLAGEQMPVPGVRVPPDEHWIDALEAFTGDPLTPRQAYHLTLSVAGMEDDGFVGWDDYLQGKNTIDDLMMLPELPDWVLFMVNTVWLQRFRQVFVNLGRRIDRGEPPYPRCMAERVALWIMFKSAQETEDDIEADIVTPDIRARLPLLDDEREDWERTEDQLFGEDYDFQFIWLPNFTRSLFGHPVELSKQFGVDLGTFHPFRWWETIPDESL